MVVACSTTTCILAPGIRLPTTARTRRGRPSPRASRRSTTRSISGSASCSPSSRPSVRPTSLGATPISPSWWLVEVPTGVEMAATIAELRRYTLARDFRHIDPREATVMLLEGGPRILPTYPEELSAKAKAKLRGLGVEVRENMLVSNIKPGYIEAAGWTIPDAHRRVGRRHARIARCSKTLDTPLDRMGRAIVEPDCTIPGHPRGVRHRRRGALRGSGAGHSSWRRTHRHADGPLRRARHCRRPAGKAARAVQVFRQGPARRHRPRPGGGQTSGSSASPDSLPGSSGPSSTSPS